MSRSEALALARQRELDLLLARPSFPSLFALPFFPIGHLSAARKLSTVSKRSKTTHSVRSPCPPVQVDASADPPVCRLVDFEALRYEEKQREKESRKKMARCCTADFPFPPPPLLLFSLFLGTGVPSSLHGVTL